MSSDYEHWSQGDHADRYLLYPKNIGPYLSIDEVALSRGELYTVLSNKSGRSKRGTLVALIKGTRCEDIIGVLEKLPNKDKVKEVTLDMAPSMELAISSVFTKASLVSDRFHVVRLLTDALQKERIEYRWLAIEEENQRIMQAKKQGKKHIAE